MPCDDQTEYLELYMDDNEIIQDFLLRKRTCGKNIGEQLLHSYVVGKSIEELFEKDIFQIVSDLDTKKRVDEFLLFKQYFSIQSALRVLFGVASGQKRECFELDEYIVDPESSKVAGFVSVNLVSEEIKSCGKCKSCPSA